MQLTRGLVLALLATVGSPLMARAETDPLPYNYVQLEERITVTPQDGTRGRLSIKGGVELLEYREVQHDDVFALATVAARQPVVAAVLLYTSSVVYVVNPGLLLPVDHVTTLSTQPPDRTSLLRL